MIMYIKKYKLQLIIFLFLGLQTLYLFMPISGVHRWRQATTFTVAKNFYTQNMNIMLPRIDVTEKSNGITGMEFPIYQWILHLFFYLGIADFVLLSKIINILITLFALYVLLKLKEELQLKIENINTAFFFLFNPFIFIFAAKTMPEIFALSMMILGSLFLFQFFKYKNNFLDVEFQPQENSLLLKEKFLRRSKLFFLALFFLTIGSLARPFFIFWNFLIIFFFVKSFLNNKKIAYDYLLMGIFILALFAFWYFYWSPYLIKKYEIEYFFMGKTKTELLSEILNIKFLPELFKVLFQDIISWFFLPFFIVGLIKLKEIKGGDGSFIFLAIIPIISLLGVIAVSGRHFSPHYYYFAALIPAVCFITAKGFEYFFHYSKKISLIVIVLLTIGFVTNYGYTFKKDSDYYQLKEYHENVVSQRTKRGQKILMESFSYDLGFHIIDRTGWALEKAILYNLEKIRQYKKEKAEWVLISLENQWQLFSIDDWITNLQNIDR